MTSQLKILLAGGGDIATRLAACESLQSTEKIAVRRTAVNKLEAGITGLRCGDLRDAGFLQHLLAEAFDVVVVTVTPDEFSDKGYRDSYVAIAENLSAAIRQLSKESPKLLPKLILWVSSTSVYGDFDGAWIDEASVTEPAGFSGKRLLEAEQIIANISVASPLAVTVESLLESTVVRFSGIYGPGRNRLLEQVKAGRIVTSEPVLWTNRIHSDDCAGVLAHLIGLHQTGQQLDDCYVASDCEPVPSHIVQQWLTEQLKVSVDEPLPGKPGASKRCSNSRLLDSGYQFIYPGFRAGYSQLLGGDRR